MIVAIIFLGGISVTFLVLFLITIHKYNKLRKRIAKALQDSRSLNKGTDLELLDCDYLSRFRKED